MARLNNPGRDRLAAIWEVVVLNAFSMSGVVRHEAATESGKRPDITFDDGVMEITADVTTVSDKGLHEQNPIEEFCAMLEGAKTKLGLPYGGLTVTVESDSKSVSSGRKAALRIPERRHLSDLIDKRIMPDIQRQFADGIESPVVVVSDDDAGVRIAIEADRRPFVGAVYPSYTSTYAINSNPLYNALRGKAKQLLDPRTTPQGLVGVIVGDGGSNVFADVMSGSGALDAKTVAEDFLRQNGRMHFVFLLSVKERRDRFRQVEYCLFGELVCSVLNAPPPELGALVKRVVGLLPKPVSMPYNASRGAREAGMDLGHHGGFVVSGDRVKVSAREVVEVLSGRRTVEDINAESDVRLQGLSRGPSSMPQLMKAYLDQGRMPTKVSLIKAGEDSGDDWVEFEFGPPDPAISPFR